jgi:putative SOS response-associated peptidase YedK
MCGHVRLSSDVSEIKLVFSIPPHRPTPNFPPSWTWLRPTSSRWSVTTEKRESAVWTVALGPCSLLGQGSERWFCQHQRESQGDRDQAGFRDAFQRRRCLVPVDSFYEWKKTGTGKQPYAIALANGSLMALAGGRDGLSPCPGASEYLLFDGSGIGDSLAP